MRHCKSCGLPENYPRASFDARGICAYCIAHRHAVDAGKRPAQLRQKYARQFRSLIKKRSPKSEYDVLLCYSGGKDSSYTLSLLRKKYRLRVLAFTFDNGFIPKGTLRNIQRMTHACKAESLIVSPPGDILNKLFVKSSKNNRYASKSIERASSICTSCIGLVKYLAFKIAIRKKIPFIAFGWTPGQAPIESSLIQMEPSMLKKMEMAIKKPMQQYVGEGIRSYFLSKTDYDLADTLPYLVHPAAFEKYNEKQMIKVLRRMGWKRPRGLDANSSNCMLNSFAVVEHMKRYGYNPYAFEVARLVREGFMSRASGMKRMNVSVDPVTLRRVKRKLKV